MNGLFSIDTPLWNFMDKVLHLLLLNLLWLVCCLPIITIGASTTALYSVMLKYTKNEEGYMCRQFFHAFRDNFFQSTVIWFFMAALGILLGLDAIVYLRIDTPDITHILLMTVFFSGLLLYVFVSMYIYALTAAFQNSVAGSLKNALILSICNWPSSILMIGAGFTILAVGMTAFPPLLFIGFAFFSYLSSLLLNRIFKRLTPSAQSV